ncbi:magnesium-protoporphyrin IX monomethyl ester (oxidative) cyclase [Rubricella aquisinus]|uniref:Aerobic magnesium-protoporphyrin IX monomethyl ester [oxidative] cyclase n=1 Tax=Rubricella aquisinus TaxID=2028108 RepID=A0A840WFW5_9RHOB|nr:magnesium-protoporphyrin IX monomethyl ester (oxidative) cyclase [Rubricella aquisinus]MBB5514049.1 magnesium-protoporphyrin IX monomethyl ester (oxidative) cyclase [Rubricella aquisinus]
MNVQADITPEELERDLTQEDTQRMATETTLLNPRFYTTDFEALDAIDVSPVQEEWDALIAELKSDPNKGHFKKNETWDTPDFDAMEPELKKELMDFLVSSLTAEFSGCVLYKEMKRRGTNEDVKTLFALMARDEARHAGFINDALREADVAVNLGFLTKAKKYTYFKPKFIFYATYLSEKIGYARYITIFRHLEQHPENRIHPIFKWFEEWCNDEFRHGEAFSLLMRADPKLLSGHNKLWIKFFLVAVFSTMYVRDHARPAFHKALGIDIDWYDHEVLKKTSEISKQCFPIELDLEHPRWKKGLVSLRDHMFAAEAAEKRGSGMAKRYHMARAAMVFVSLYTIPSKKNQIPALSRLEPSY